MTARILGVLTSNLLQALLAKIGKFELCSIDGCGLVNENGFKPMPVGLNATPFCNEHGDIDGLVATFRNNRPIEVLRKELRHTFTFEDIVSKSDQILRILDILPNVADSDSPVFVTGPSA